MPRHLAGRSRSLDSLERRLVWIFGSPRSGSTWLLRLLAHPLAPDDAAPTGVARLRSAPGDSLRAVPLNEPYIPHHLSPPLPDEQLFSEALPAATLPELRAPSPNYFLSDRFAEVWKPELRRLVLRRIEAQARAVGEEHRLRAPLVVVKEPNGSLGAAFVMSLLPRARLIFLLRDGRDVVDSMLDAVSAGGWLAGHSKSRRDPAAARLELIRREARMWLAQTSAVQRAFGAHPPALRRLVRYEELRADAASVLLDLDRWLEIDRGVQARGDALRWNDFETFPAQAKGRGMPLRAATPGLWRQNTNQEEQQVMHEVIGAKLVELGYEP